MADDRQWQQTAQELMNMLYRLAWGILRSDADAQDAVQTAFLRTWERRGGIRADALRTYMIRTLINECRNVQRKQRRVIPVEEIPQTAAPEKQSLREICEAIGALPEQLRLPLYLKCLEDLSEKEAAGALRIPVTTFKSRLHRARKQLRLILEREVELE